MRTQSRKKKLEIETESIRAYVAKTKVPLRSCRRQFDNLRRAYSYIEEQRSFSAEEQRVRPFTLIGTRYLQSLTRTNNMMDGPKTDKKGAPAEHCPASTHFTVSRACMAS